MLIGKNYFLEIKYNMTSQSQPSYTKTFVIDTICQPEKKQFFKLVVKPLVAKPLKKTLIFYRLYIIIMF